MYCNTINHKIIIGEDKVNVLVRLGKDGRNGVKEFSCRHAEWKNPFDHFIREVKSSMWLRKKIVITY